MREGLGYKVDGIAVLKSPWIASWPYLGCVRNAAVELHCTEVTRLEFGRGGGGGGG
jgi:hypothetical protein